MCGAQAAAHVRAVRYVPAAGLCRPSRKPLTALRAMLVLIFIAELAYTVFLRSSIFRLV